MKEAKDYYKDLAADAMKLKRARLDQYSHAEKIRKKPFPVTKVIFFVCGILAFAIFNSSSKDMKGVLSVLTQKDGIKTLFNQIKSGEFGASKQNVSTTHVNMNDLASIDASGLTPEEKNAAKARFEATHVVIEGKYYEKRADNIYNINGRKVFFINNRSSESIKK